MIQTLVYPTSVTELNKFSNGLYPALYPIYKVYGAKQSTSGTVLSTTKGINIFLYINISGVDQDLTFTMNGINYSNSYIVNDRNIFLKGNDLDQVETSIIAMLLLNETLEDFNYTLLSKQVIGSSKAIYFSLTSKYSGDNINLDVSFPLIDSSLVSTIISGTHISYLVLNSLGSTQMTFDITNVVAGLSVNEDVENYELGLDIYRVTTTVNYLNGSGTQDLKLITSISKKGFNVVDFDLSNIIHNDIDKFIPTLETFNIKQIKYLEYYQLNPWQKYIDNQIDPLNTYSNIIYATGNLDNLYALDARFPLFENYNNAQYSTLTPSMAQRNLDLENNGTFGNVYLNNLTRQPTFKQLNRGYELLYNEVLIDKVSYNSNLHDTITMNFYYGGTNGSETISQNTISLLDIGSLRYVNQFCFKISNLKNLIVGNFNNVIQIDVNFSNSNYKDSKNVIYNTQSYFIDQTQSFCDEDDSIDYTPIVFKNSRGTFDIFEFKDIQQLITNRNIQTIQTPYTYKSNEYSEFNKIFDIDYSKVYTTSTPVLTQDVFDWLEDLIQSDQVYIAIQDKLYPIIILTNDYGYKINTDLIINITFQYSRPN